MYITTVECTGCQKGIGLCALMLNWARQCGGGKIEHFEHN